MINPEILKELMTVNDEEQAILGGLSSIDRTLYMSGSKNVVNSRKLLDAGKLITIRKHTRFVHFPAHTHDYVEVVYMCCGSTVHIINGKEILLSEGELLFLSQHARQEIKKAGEGDIAVNFIVLPEFFDSTLSIIGDEETPLKKFITNCLCKKGGVGYLHFKVSEILPVQNLVENLIWTLINETKNKIKINRTTMELLFLQLLSHTDSLAYDNPEEETVIKVLKYVEENYVNGSLTEAAKIVHHDVCWLSREIKRKTGSSYTEIVQNRRLSQAVFLLKITNMKISDISIAVGYDNISYFHRLFYSAYSVSPKQYRSANKDTFSVNQRPFKQE